MTKFRVTMAAVCCWLVWLVHRVVRRAVPDFSNVKFTSYIYVSMDTSNYFLSCLGLPCMSSTHDPDPI